MTFFIAISMEPFTYLLGFTHILVENGFVESVEYISDLPGFDRKLGQEDYTIGYRSVSCPKPAGWLVLIRKLSGLLKGQLESR